MKRYHALLLLVVATLLINCRAQTAAGRIALPPTVIPVTPSPVSEMDTVATAVSSTTPRFPTPTTIATRTKPPPPTPTTPPTATDTPTLIPTATSFPTTTPSPTTIPSCTRRIPGDELFTNVTLTYGLSRDYEPADLVSLSDYLPDAVTKGYPTYLREVAVEPLVQLIQAMQAEGLTPQIISGYRSYSAQALAYNKWLEKHPDRATILSAPPGHSEHQLGTTVDFGSPELPDIIGEEGVEFHTYFYKTSEGQWLLENAHKHGFTLSYPREAFELTGFYYEPWHYRYVGVDLATELHDSGQTLTAYLLERQPEPCIPTE